MSSPAPSAAEVYRARLRLLRLLRYAPWPAVLASVLVQLVIGVAPLAFMLFSSAAVGKVAAAAAGGTRSAAWHGLEVELLLAAVMLVIGLVLTPVQKLVSWTLQYRADVHVFRRLMTANFSDPGISLMERSDVRSSLDEAVSAMRWSEATPGGAAAASLTLLARYTAFAGALAIIAVRFSLLAALAAGAGGMALRVTHRRGAARYSAAIVDTIQLRRRHFFLSGQGVSTGIGKEARVFGFGSWLADRGQQEGLGYLRMLWKIRSRAFITPFLVASAVTALGGAVALAGLASRRFGGGLPVGTTTLVAQAVIAVLGIGANFEESDYVISYGLTCMRHLERVEAAMTRSREQERPGVPAVACPVRESIRFEDIGFTYPGAQRPVLSGFTLDLRAGTSLAIVGVNGAGKSTLVKLLCRFYEPQAGRVLADGTDIRGYDAAAWQRQIAAEFQDFGRYPVSAADNIGFGAAELVGDREAIELSARRAGAAEFLRDLGAGFDTLLNRAYRGGTDLSGGQWQRVALARTMLAVEGGASVMILDEPTASLDIRAEADFIESFLELTRGTTTIVVSHRFATVRRADRIVVLDEGRIVEDGTHAQLVELGGRYAEMFGLQAARFAEPAAAGEGG